MSTYITLNTFRTIRLDREYKTLKTHCGKLI